MSKYLVNYRNKSKHTDMCFESSCIYETAGDMTVEDIERFENEKSTGLFIVTMVGFSKLSEKKKINVEEKLPNLAVFFLYDTSYDETCLVYTNVDDVVSYLFDKGKFFITLKEGEIQKTYECPIPGIWIGGKDVMSSLPPELKNKFSHSYLFSIHYEKYKQK